MTNKLAIVCIIQFNITIHGIVKNTKSLFVAHNMSFNFCQMSFNIIITNEWPF